MSPLYEGLPAVIYSGLWVLKIFRKLEKRFPNSIKMAILLTDSPPAFLIKIDNGDFDIEILENIKDLNELDTIDCDTYLALPTEILYKGAGGIREGIETNEVKVKNFDAITILAKFTGVG
ncbi:MAG: hypothetical protein ACFFDK_13860 [Promethearchaeota archaeon]